MKQSAAFVPVPEKPLGESAVGTSTTKSHLEKVGKNNAQSHSQSGGYPRSRRVRPDVPDGGHPDPVRIQATPLPTAILSTQTVGYNDFTLLDLTDDMVRILDHWERLGLRFDGVYSGFMASTAQMDSAARCIRNCLAPGGLAVVDPVLGDDGKLIPTMTPEMVAKMRWLITCADLITPNFTEVCLLLDEPYSPEADLPTLKGWLRRLAENGPKTVVATSVPLADGQASRKPECTSVLAYERDEDRFWRVDCSYIPAYYPGTGDVFASVLTGSLLQGDSLAIALDRAVQFVTLGIRATFGQGLPNREGILLERILDTLRAPLGSYMCRLVD